jgi:tetratricopeptide (TPR) repeat protein
MSAKALELDPSLIIPHVTRAYILDRLTKKEESRVEIQKALEKDPESPEALCCIGLFSLRDNKIEDAEKYLLKAIEIRPSFYPAQYNLNLVYYSLRDSRKVVGQSLVLFRLEPNIANLLQLTYVFSRLPRFRFINLLILLISAALSLWVGPNLILIVTFLLVTMSFFGGIFIGFLAKGTQWIQFAYSLMLGFSIGIIGSILYIIMNNIHFR